MPVIFVPRRLPAEKISKSTKEFILGRSHFLAETKIAKNVFQILQIDSSTKEVTRTINTNVRAAISFVSHRKQLQSITRRRMDQNFQRNRPHISFISLKILHNRQHQKSTKQQLHRSLTRRNKPRFHQRMFFSKQNLIQSPANRARQTQFQFRRFHHHPKMFWELFPKMMFPFRPSNKKVVTRLSPI